MTTRRWFLGMLAIAAGCHVGGTLVTSVRPPDYAQPILSAQTARDADRRPDLAHCVALWSAHAGARAKLFEVIGDRRYLEADGAMLLEFGNSGFSRYGYVLVSRGHVVRDLPGGREGAPAASPGTEKRLESLVQLALPGASGSASATVFDGDCYFLTYRMAGESRVVAIYERSDDPSLRELLELLRPLVTEPSTPN